MAKFISLFVLLTTLTSCAGVSIEECKDINWGALGYETASHGRKLNQAIDSRARECSDEFGIEPDKKAVETGYRDGLVFFCNRNQGRDFGARGGTYRNTCPTEKENEFLMGYQLGRIEYTGARMTRLEEEVEDLRGQVRRRDDRINNLENELSRSRK